MKYLITGPSGAGKTYLSKYFREHGFNAIDADMVEGLGEWYDEQGNVVLFPKDAGEDFFNMHPFLWDQSILKATLDHQTEDVYLFGFAGNVFECLDYFDKAYYLDIPAETILERMAAEDRDNPNGMGKTEEQRQVTVDYVMHSLRPEALKRGLEFVDGTLPPTSLLSALVKREAYDS